MPDNKIIILGAGASIGSNRFPIQSSWSQVATKMPSAENFFYDLFQTNKTENRPAGSLNFLGLMYEGLNDLIIRAWNINDEGYYSEEWKGVNIEEVMTFFEIGSKMYPPNSNIQKTFKKAQKYLLDFMYPLLPLRCEEQHCEYLTSVFLDLKKTDTVISYNWDTIADYTLSKINATHIRNYATLLRDNHVVPSHYRSKGLLLKLHGSFNWMNCANNECLYHKRIRPPFQKNRYKLLNLRDLWKCECGSDKLKPLIVPPVSEKMIHKDSFLRNQWLIAREKLLDVTELIFIGYSFPATDYYSEWLFRQLNFIEKRKNVKIVVVNPEYSKKSSVVRKRYDTIFRGYEIEHFKTLKDYAK